MLRKSRGQGGKERLGPPEGFTQPPSDPELSASILEVPADVS